MRRYAAFIICLLVSSLAAAANLVIHHFDIGNGDCILVVGSNGNGLLLDCGTAKKCNAQDPGRVLAEIAALLAGNDYYMLASHYHADHIGYLDDAVATLGLPLITFDRGGTYSSATFDSYLAAITTVRQTVAIGDMGASTWARMYPDRRRVLLARWRELPVNRDHRQARLLRRAARRRPRAPILFVVPPTAVHSLGVCQMSLRPH